jgi:hypothetical protein
MWERTGCYGARRRPLTPSHTFKKRKMPAEQPSGRRKKQEKVKKSGLNPAAWGNTRGLPSGKTPENRLDRPLKDGAVPGGDFATHIVLIPRTKRGDNAAGFPVGRTAGPESS